MADRTGSVLITSAGRRVQLVRFFQRAMSALGLPGRVLVSDANPEWSAAARVADAAFRAPPVTVPEYEPFLRDLIEKENVRLVVPTIDTELLALALLRDEIAATDRHIAVSDPDLVGTCRDKRRSDAWFKSMGFETPAILDRRALQFPCFVKPYNGSLSRGAKALASADMLSPEMLADDTLLFMELLGPAEFDEYTIDAYYDGHGTLKCLVPRQRVEVRGGEISKGAALKGATYDYVRERLGRIAGARGCLTFQFFASRRSARWVAIELNPRFGGGYPLSQAAGVDYPAWLIAEYLLGHEVAEFNGWRHGTAMTRFDDEVIFMLPESV